MLKLIGILIIIVGFGLKLDTIAIVLLAGLATGIVAGFDIMEIFSILGEAFINTRYMSLFLLTLAVIGILERNGLRETATKVISKLNGATGGKVLSAYVIIRTLASAFSIRIQGHVQFIRPLIYPMVKGAAEKATPISNKDDEKIKAISNATENYGNFFGQNIFIAAPGVLLIVGTLAEAGIKVDAYEISKIAIPIGVLTVVFSIVQNHYLDKQLKKSDSTKKTK